MDHRAGADRLWPTADPRPAAPPRGARVAGRDLSAVSGLNPLEIGTAAAPAAREPGRVAGRLPPWPRGPAPACRSDPALPRAGGLPWTHTSLRGWAPATTPPYRVLSFARPTVCLSNIPLVYCHINSF